ncbi:MAG: DUF86 domain-containing protein [Candidatus Woesearchaeota archaeon]|nr:DUF86 domain-containing protein [Nanoarchaeota archaeon]MBU1973793.1 DUF86 domain-containing protein [Nanoarchaeota archaeon]
MKKDTKIFIEHILENINDIEEFSLGLNKEELNSNKLKQKAIIRSLEIIGEAVKNIPNSFRNKYPKIEWNKITGMRDKLIHHYFGLDFDTVWNVIENELPKLKKQVEKIIEDLS